MQSYKFEFRDITISLKLLFVSSIICGVLFAILCFGTNYIEDKTYLNYKILIIGLSVTIYKYRNKANLFVFVLLSIYLSLFFISSKFSIFDLSPDGQTDHFPIIYLLSNYFDLNSEEFYKLNKYSNIPLNLVIFDPYFKLIFHFPYFIFGFIYSFFDNLTVIFLFKLLFVLYVFTELYETLSISFNNKFKYLNKLDFILFSIALCFIPVVLTQLLNTYNDGISYLIIILSLNKLLTKKFILSSFLFILGISFKSNNIYLLPIYSCILLIHKNRVNNLIINFKGLLLFSIFIFSFNYPTYLDFINMNYHMISSGKFYGSNDEIRNLNWIDDKNNSSSNIVRFLESKTSNLGNTITKPSLTFYELSASLYRRLDPDIRYGGGGLIWKLVPLLVFLYFIINFSPPALSLFVILFIFTFLGHSWFDRHFPFYYSFFIINTLFIINKYYRRMILIFILTGYFFILTNIIIGNFYIIKARDHIYSLIINKYIPVETTNFYGPILDIINLSNKESWNIEISECRFYIYVPRSETRFCKKYITEQEFYELENINKVLINNNIGSIY
jgi:hypothetical protein